MSTHEVYSTLREPLVDGNLTPADVTRDVCAPMEGKPSGLWWAGFLIAVSFLGLGVASVAYLMAKGVGVWGLNRTVGWGFDITRKF